MTTYLTTDGNEYPEYTKFPRQSTPCGLIWVSLEVAPNTVRKFELSSLREVKSPFDSGMVYDQPAEAQNFDSGLNYIYPLPYVRPLILCLPDDSLGQVGGGKGKNKRPTIPGVIVAESSHVIVIKPVSLFSEHMRAA